MPPSTLRISTLYIFLYRASVLCFLIIILPIFLSNPLYFRFVILHKYCFHALGLIFLFFFINKFLKNLIKCKRCKSKIFYPTLNLTKEFRKPYFYDLYLFKISLKILQNCDTKCPFCSTPLTSLIKIKDSDDFDYQPIDKISHSLNYLEQEKFYNVEPYQQEESYNLHPSNNNDTNQNNSYTDNHDNLNKDEIYENLYDSLNSRIFEESDINEYTEHNNNNKDLNNSNEQIENDNNNTYYNDISSIETNSPQNNNDF